MLSRRTELLLLAAVVVPLALLRFSLHSGAGPYGIDGSYYYQIARNVSEGRGLVTNVDLYHQGLDPLPAPTNIYPLWPLVLGQTARMVGLDAAVRHLPRMLYLAALFLLYALARRLGGPVVALVMLALLGTNEIFFTSTTFPYTEGLAFALCSAALLAVFRPGAGAALAAGVVSGLALLSRSQMLMLIGAIAFSLFVAAALRRRSWRELAAFLAGAVAIVTPWLLWVASFARPFSLRLIYASYQQTPQIAAYPLGMPWSARTLVRGVAAAFNPWNDESFVALFGAAALLVPVAAIHWLWRRRRGSAGIEVGALAIVLAGALLAFMLLLTPQQFFRTWLFGWRHGLPLVYLITAATVELVRHGQRFLRWGAVAVLLLSIGTGGLAVLRAVQAGPPGGAAPAERALAQWLKANHADAVVLTTKAQTLSVYSRASFRWATCDEPADVTRNILRYARTDYIAVYERETRCAFIRGLRDVTEPAAAFGTAPDRIYLLRVRRHGSPSPS